MFDRCESCGRRLAEVVCSCCAREPGYCSCSRIGYEWSDALEEWVAMADDDPRNACTKIDDSLPFDPTNIDRESPRHPRVPPTYWPDRVFWTEQAERARHKAIRDERARLKRAQGR